jgi:hypothetical protein
VRSSPLRGRSAIRRPGTTCMPVLTETVPNACKRFTLEVWITSVLGRIHATGTSLILGFHRLSGRDIRWRHGQSSNRPYIRGSPPSSFQESSRTRSDLYDIAVSLSSDFDVRSTNVHRKDIQDFSRECHVCPAAASRASASAGPFDPAE